MIDEGDMNIRTSASVASLFAGLVAASSLVDVAAAADTCPNLAGRVPVYMCGSFLYNSGQQNMFTIKFGPGNAFAITGVPGNQSNGTSGSGTFACVGNNFFTTHYTTTSSNVPNWVAHLPEGGAGYDTATPIVFTFTMAPGACTPH